MRSGENKVAFLLSAYSFIFTLFTLPIILDTVDSGYNIHGYKSRAVIVTTPIKRQC